MSTVSLDLENVYPLVVVVTMIPPLFVYAGGGVTGLPERRLSSEKARRWRDGFRKRQNQRPATMKMTKTGTTTPIVIWAERGRPLSRVEGVGVSWGAEVGDEMGDAVDVGSWVEEDRVVLLVEDDMEVGRGVVEAGEDRVEVKRVEDGLMSAQYGVSESRPMQV